MFRKDTVSPRRYPFAFYPDLETTFFGYFHRRTPAGKQKASPPPETLDSLANCTIRKLTFALRNVHGKNVFTVHRLSVLMSNVRPLLFTASQRPDHGSDKLGSLRGRRHTCATKRRQKWPSL